MDIPINPNHKESAAPPYETVIEQIVQRWAIGKPLLETTGKPSGFYRLTNYLREYILTNKTLPKGVHTMPEGRDRLNNIEPSFLVDFDTITELIDTV